MGKKANGNGIRFNGAAKWIVIAAATLITIGGMIQTLYSHSARLDKSEPQIQELSNKMIGIEKDVQYIKKGVEKLLKEGR